MSTPAPFDERYEGALAHETLAPSLLEFQRSWRETRDGQIADLEAARGESFEAMRHDFAAIKDGVIAELPALVAHFRTAAEAAGATVFEATSAADANRYVAQLCTDRGVTTVVKGKSMVTEELFLNEHLAAAGIRAVETDLGEWLLQLDGDRPSHVVMPAIHRRRHEVARILERELGEPFDPDDIPAMVRSARTGLRDRFLAAGVGITGANALVASSGTVMLVTNEGNGEMSASLPPVHVVVAGIEKIVPAMADAMRQVRLLARSATGQPITTYTSFFTGPAPGHELHIVLVDNGRRAMAEAEWSASALRCVKCGACANVCPAYQVVGGHAFGHVYTGPIGLVTTAFHHGLEAAAGPQSLCLSCGACETVCPVEIPLAGQILQVRRRVATEVKPSWRRRWGLRAFASRRTVEIASRALALAAWPFRRGRFTRLPFLGQRIAAWRTPPALPVTPARSRRELRSAQRVLARTGARGRRVTLLMQCVSDRLAPAVVTSTVALLRAAGCVVDVPMSQHCCGLPAIDAGDDEAARRMARQTLRTFDGTDDIVTPAPSCAIAMLHDYERLFADEPTWLERARRLRGRVHDLTGYLAGPARLPDGALAGDAPAAVAVDRFCQGANVLGRGDTLEVLVAALTGATIVPLQEAEMCCGFGGSTSLLAPELSAGVLERKLDNVRRSGARVLLTDNPGCLLHLRGGADAAELPVEVLHVAEFLASRLPAMPN
jgi:L-lactate dehydrogenase complex protein LldF